MSYLTLAFMAWGVLLATCVGFIIATSQRHRRERRFNDHAVDAIRVVHPALRKPTCPVCHYHLDGPAGEHLCPEGF